MKKSLRQLYPWHVEVPILILLSSGLCLFALWMPMMTVKKQVLWKHWHDSYSIIAGVQGLYDDKQYSLALILFFFSIVFPTAKFIALLIIWIVRMQPERRKKMLHWLGILGKWSMLDVIVVAMLIVMVKFGPLAKVEPRPGVYVFATGILLSMVTTMYVEFLARKKKATDAS